MKLRLVCTLLFVTGFGLFTSCAHVSKRMPAELERMHEFLTQNDPSTCKNYHYNFERQAPRLYNEQQTDSILDVIEYIKTECGPASNLEITRLLLLADRDQMVDSLIGRITVPQMLWYRAEQDYLIRRKNVATLYGWPEASDNTHENFTSFHKELGQKITGNTDRSLSEYAFGLYYSGKFDSAFSYIQADEMRETALRDSYDEYVRRIKDEFPTRGNAGFSFGGWIPRGDNKLIGNHPEIGLQFGGEGKRWRTDIILHYRFIDAKNNYEVDSLGTLVSTDDFSSWLIGVECGYKFFDKSVFSTDIFVGLGYDAILSIKKAGDPEEHKIHDSFTASVGLRQRIFLDRRRGLYIGGSVRYNLVDYDNSGGTDLSGNTMTFSVIFGWSLHKTLYQFLDKLNYKGNWRR